MSNENLDLREIFTKAVSLGASDVHVTVGSPVVARLNSKFVPLNDKKLMPDDTVKLVKAVLKEHQLKKFLEDGEIDFSFSIAGIGRFRVNCYKQRGSFGLAFRVVPNAIPSLDELGVPSVLKKLSEKKRGLILVTGPTGSGKSTTLASVIDIINNRDESHIITIEDPIEYLHSHKKSLVNQREIGHDSKSFANALRASLRQDPDVILVGEMRDLETISTALTAAETGHLVMSTLHTVGAASTIDRIIDVFPPHQQQQIRIQLAAVLQGVVSQQLLPKKGGNGRVVACEVLVVTDAARNLIREGKTHQIQTIIQTGKAEGMVGMDIYLLSLFKAGKIDANTVKKHCVDVNFINKQLEYGGV